MPETVSTIFLSQQANTNLIKQCTAKERIQKLKNFKSNIVEMEEEILQALYLDLRKSKFEATITELSPVYLEIKFAIKNLEAWMKPKKIFGELQNMLNQNRIYYEPKGVCLIIAPWNYPFQLLIAPLVSAIAAGNCCILEPSEISSETSKVLKRLVDKTFLANEIALFEGDSILATELLKLPFDHIFYTGSTAVGKLVMEAAAKNLTSVTLELGGKSPAVISEKVNVAKVAETIIWGKYINAG